MPNSKLSITYNVMALPSQLLIQAAFPALDPLYPRYLPTYVVQKTMKKKPLERKMKDP